MPLYDSPRLAEGLNIRKLLADGVGELVLDEEDAAFKDVPDYERFVETAYDYEEYKDHVNLDVIQCDLAGIDLGQTAFDVIGLKMENVTPDGKVKKRVIEPGKEPIPKDAMMYVNYDLYLEMQEVPIDSSYLRLGKPERLQIGQNNLILGFDIALSSMAVGEKAHFLIHYEYAFGKLGSPPRIPPESYIFATIQVLNVVDPALEQKELTSDEMRSYAIVSPRAEAEHNIARDLFSRKQVESAVYHYRAEERLLLRCPSSDPEEERQRREKLFTVYVNMAVCYNHPKMRDPSRTLNVTEKAMVIDSQRAARSAKLHYNRGVARSSKREYKLALKDFKTAEAIEPRNPEILKKILLTEEKIDEEAKAERELSVRAMAGYRRGSDAVTDTAADGDAAPAAQNKPDGPADHSGQPPAEEKPSDAPSDSVEDKMEGFLVNFKNGSNAFVNLGFGFSPSERRTYRNLCEKLGLVYREECHGPMRREVVISKRS